MSVPGEPAQVFPLLCPQREHEWIDGWSATLLRSESGVAEPGCVFQTGSGSPAERCTWIIVEHIAPKRVVFALVQPGQFAEILCVDLSADGERTVLTWRRQTTPLSADGEATVAQRLADADARHARLARALSHFLTTHTCLVPTP